MDKDTAVLLIMTFAVFCWWFKQRLDENRQLVRETEREEADRLERAERVRQLMNRD